MRPPHLVYCLGIVQLDVEVLVDALEGAADLDFVFELDGDFVLDERFEETSCSLKSASVNGSVWEAWRRT
jgi:hypothetical protein